MNRLALIVLVVAPLTGCSKFMGTITGASPAPRTLTVGILGQSNAAFFSTMGGPNALSKELGAQVVVVNCAVGGSGLYLWQAGGSLYDACLPKLKAAHVDFIWFDQGEAEAEYGQTGTSSEASTWAYRFTGVVNSLRSDLGPIPVYFARLGDFWQGDRAGDLVREQQGSVSVGVATMVNIDGIAPDPSNVPHYTSGGYTAIAQRLAAQVKSAGR